MRARTESGAVFVFRYGYFTLPALPALSACRCTFLRARSRGSLFFVVGRYEHFRFFERVASVFPLILEGSSMRCSSTSASLENDKNNCNCT